MKFAIGRLQIVLAAIIVGGSGVLAGQFLGGGTSGSAAAGTQPTVDVKLPVLSAQARAGRADFDANCAACHGKSGSGTNLGPPLVHDIYNPGHHADEAFYRAVRQGVQQHHWPFGNMAPVPQVSDSQVTEIVRYVRELQEANGIVYRPHQM